MNSQDSASPATSPRNLRPGQRAVLLQHGGLLGPKGKTGLSLLRYRSTEVVAVIDHETAGQSLRALTRLPLERDIPIVRNVEESLTFTPDVLAIGIAPSGGRLPPPWLEEVRTAVRAGVSILNGLHTPLNEDAEISASLRPGVWVWDMRREPAGLPIASAAARNLACHRVLFVGTDMGVGKMTAALELDRAARQRGLRSKFIATGQAGMMLSGDGVCLDAVRVDFAAGAVEQQLMRHGPSHEVLWIEGQGSLLNPASTATLPLIRGSQPTHLILVHPAGMATLRDFPFVRVPPLRDVVSLYEWVASAAGAFPRVPVIGVALNTWHLDAGSAARAAADVTKETGLPCVDTVRQGSQVLLDAVLAGGG